MGVDYLAIYFTNRIMIIEGSALLLLFVNVILCNQSKNIARESMGWAHVIFLTCDFPSIA